MRSRASYLGKVYPITDSRNVGDLGHVELAQEFLEGGARFFQVREKIMPDALFYEQLVNIRTLCCARQAQFIVNDRVDLALAAEADGVHLGQTDLPVAVARRLMGQQAIIGFSTHTRRQFEAAQELDIDYIALGPVFPTVTKKSDYPPVGVELVRQLSRASKHPVVAIGGINLENAAQLWDAGVASVAVVSDIVNHPVPAERVRQYLGR